MEIAHGLFEMIDVFKHARKKVDPNGHFCIKACVDPLHDVSVSKFKAKVEIFFRERFSLSSTCGQTEIFEHVFVGGAFKNVEEVC